MTPGNLTLNTSTAGRPVGVIGFEEGYAAGFDAAASHVDGLVMILLLTFVAEIAFRGADRYFDMQPAWRNRVLPTFDHAALVIRVGICLALVTRTYLFI